MTPDQWIRTPMSYDVRDFRLALRGWRDDELAAALERVTGNRLTKQKMLEVEIRRRKRLALKELAELRLAASKWAIDAERAKSQGGA